MTYLLDTMIVSFFLQANREEELAAASRRCSMVIVDEVRRELENDRDRGGKAFKRWLAASNIELRSIEVGTPASATLSEMLNPVSPSRGRGERASIALAASDASLTFVTHDRGGMWIALREIWSAGERLLGLAVFLRRLFDQGVLQDPTSLDEVMSLAVDPAQRPTWWAAWRASLVPSVAGGTEPPAT